MKTVAGLWIDHRKAFIVTLSDKGETTKEILSNNEKQLSRVDGVKSTAPFEPLLVKSDDSQERAYDGHLESFYKEVSGSIQDSGSILLMGPGEAKEEFRKFMDKNGLSGRIAAVQTADRLTNPQIAEKTRNFFPLAN
jgi:stalled ribosome rescue protein Dom34